MANKWLTIECFPDTPMVVAPAELALAWPGNKPTGEVDIYLTYFQPLMKDLKKAHPELTWEGHTDTPYVRVPAAEAKAVNDKLFAFLKTKFPDAVKKKQKEMVVFKVGGSHKIATTVPVSKGETLMKGTGKDAWTVDVGGKKLLLWQVKTNEVHALATDDGFVLVDSETGDDDHEVKGKGTAHGTWTFGKGLAVAHGATFAIDECKGQTGKLETIAAVVAKKPAALVKPMQNAMMHQGAVLKIPAGTYRIETGGDKKTRWLRAAR